MKSFLGLSNNMKQVDLGCMSKVKTLPIKLQVYFREKINVIENVFYYVEYNFLNTSRILYSVLKYVAYYGHNFDKYLRHSIINNG